ncbi:hypothetical protein BC628DRAFT_1420390 [Trametes gibbosa]|nr:hypothetical protein BC628DRAFT_1420390 [Trametes gibbosa]
MRLSVFSVLAASLGFTAAATLASTASAADPPAGTIVAPVAHAPIAPGALFDFSYKASADYGRSTYAYSVYLFTETPESFTPADVFAGGYFFGRFDYANYPAVPYPKNPAPAQLQMPNFAAPKGPGFSNTYTLTDQTFTLAVIEEWDGSDNGPDSPPGMKMSLTVVPIVYNATTA